MNLILSSPHRKILDIGPGFGKYGVLCREYCDLIPAWYEKKLNGFDQKNWQCTIDCIEPCDKYITPLHKYIYDNIYTGKAEDIITTLGDYDLILVIGVIEHIEKLTGIRVLKDCRAKAKAVIVVTPNGFLRQDAVWDNPLEEHKSGWYPEDFDILNFRWDILRSQNKIIAYYGH